MVELGAQEKEEMDLREMPAVLPLCFSHVKHNKLTPLSPLNSLATSSLENRKQDE